MVKGRILIVGYYGYDNLGDDLMLLSLLNEIKEKLPKLEIIILARESQNLVNLIETYDNVEIEYFKSNSKAFNFYLYIKTIFTVDLTIWGGGTCFSDQDGVGNFKFFIFNLLTRRKFSYLGVGIGELKNSKARLITKILLRASEFTSFRDKKSLDIANELTSDSNHFTLSSDLTYLLDFSLHKPNTKNKNYILISLRDLTNFYSLDEINERHRVLLTFIKHIENIDEYDIVVMPIDSIKDLDVNKGLYSVLKGEFSTSKISYFDNRDMDKKLEVILNSSLNITERLHSIIISVLNNVNCIPLSYSPKINRFCEEVNYLNFISFDEVLTVDRLQKCYESSRSGESVDLVKVEELSEKSRYNIDLLQRFYGA